NRRARFAVVGCGRISEKHFEALRAHADSASVVAVCDPDEAALRKATQGAGGTGNPDLEPLLVQSDCDVVVLCTPSGLHSSQAIRAAEAKRHVVTEKPMATRWSDGVAMVRACDTAGVRLFVVKQNRRNATLQLVKRAIDERRFGRMHLVVIN